MLPSLLRTLMTSSLRVALVLTSLAGLTGCVHALERRELDWQDIIELSAERARVPYLPPEAPLPPPYAALDYDAYRRIRFLEENTLWADEGLPFRVQFFHRGYLFREAVSVHEFSRTHIQDIPFQRQFFDYDDQALPPLRGDAAAFAGLRLNAAFNEPLKYDELVSFLGASYFRALGRGNVYGASARGLAVHLDDDHPEEFPAFREFWLQKPLGNSTQLLVYALLDSPSVSGAYRFLVTPGDPTRMEVDAVLHPRVPKAALAIAPLTSMFWYGEHSYPRPRDYRPEVHDSDGLYIQHRAGTETWRPLSPSSRIRRSEHRADSPVAFGLLQRDRDFENYQDSEAAYHRRPSVMVVPRGDWGPGSLHLMELPPNGEFADNIALAWRPDSVPPPGQPLALSYTLLWGDLPSDGTLARVGDTRAGHDLSHSNLHRVLIDFHLPANQTEWPRGVELATEALGPARILGAELLHIPGNPKRLRGSLLLEAAPDPESPPTELRAHLHSGGQPLSETWSFPWSP